MKGVKKKREINYQTIHTDGWISNEHLKTPKITRARLIYSLIDPETELIHGDIFLPTWDSTDHLFFICEKCKTAADVLHVMFDPHYAKPPNPSYALFFRLGCPKCGASGQRKIYLDRRDDPAFAHNTYDENSLYIYGRERRPYEVIKMISLEAINKLFEETNNLEECKERIRKILKE